LCLRARQALAALYNEGMSARAAAIPLFVLVFSGCTAALAQAQPRTPLVQESQPLDPRKNQKIERIRVEDEAVVIDELRVGGQTQAITVQPKGGALPSYEVVPQRADGQRASDQRDGLAGSGGQRVWNVLKF
jgi:hypothetical protein